MKEEPDDGRTFQSLIDGLDSGAIDPLSEFLKLDTIHWKIAQLKRQTAGKSRS